MMKKLLSKQILRLAISIALLAMYWLLSCTTDDPINSSRVSQLPYYNSADFTPHWLNADSDSLKNFHRIPAFRLVNQQGDTLTEKDITGKIYIANFFFTTCPGICPKMADNMQMVQEAFKDDDEVLILSHTATPESDSVAVLKEYAEAHGCISGKWHLLTGNRSEIYRLGRKYYFVEENMGINKSDDEFLHTENFVVIDRNRRIRGIYNGLNKTSVRQLIADVQTLKSE
jgi:protein SCO1/2